MSTVHVPLLWCGSYGKDTGMKQNTENFRHGLVERIEQRLKVLDMTRNAAEIKAFGKPGMIRNWSRADKNVLPRLDSIEALAPVLETTAEWLLGKSDIETGNASKPLVGTFDPDEQEHDSMDCEENGFSRDDWRPRTPGAIPELDAKLGAGEGAIGAIINLPLGNSAASAHAVVAEWLIPTNYLRNEAKAQPNQTIILEVIGDSMQPTYMPGDRVLVDLSQNQLVADTVFAISDGYSEPQIKRLQRIPFSNPTTVKIISDNPALETFEVELSRLLIIGRICGHIARK